MISVQPYVLQGMPKLLHAHGDAQRAGRLFHSFSDSHFLRSSMQWLVIYMQTTPCLVESLLPCSVMVIA